MKEVNTFCSTIKKNNVYSYNVYFLPDFEDFNLSFPSGDSMRVAAKEFADDPCASAKRATMVRAARALLSSVTRLLCVADMADVYRLLASLKLVS